MLRAHAQHQWTLGAHQTPFPQQTGTSNPFPQKDAESACATSVDAGGASDPPPPQQTGTSNPFPQKDAESACAT